LVFFFQILGLNLNSVISHNQCVSVIAWSVCRD